jgi:ferric-dicitrate binding protein FerR (iron transport regulator)
MMENKAQREHQAAVIVMAAVAGEATLEQLHTLNAWIEQDPELGSFVIDLISQEAWLSWHAVADGLEAAELTTASSAPLLQQQLQPRRARSNRILHGPFLAVSAALLIAVGALLGSGVAAWRDSSQAPQLSSTVPPSGQFLGSYTARLVDGTACLWNADSGMTIRANDRLRSGESLSLLEGLAEFEFDWDSGSASIKLEGPASLVLTAERGANLGRGKITADVTLPAFHGGSFVLGTPNGQVEVFKDASIGVSVRGEQVEVHVFRGVASLTTPWSRLADRSDELIISAGESITLQGGAEGGVQVARAEARPNEFISQVSMQSDHLLIPSEYVDEIMRSKPLLYWRFEGPSPAAVRNEMGPKYAGRVSGAIQQVSHGENQSIELGTGLTSEELSAFIVADRPFSDELSNNYSMEMWIKPSHYHWGTIVSLTADPQETGWQRRHGLLIEAGGPITDPSIIERPGRVRFLHRSPPSDDPAKGTSCFSGHPYDVRRWQHVAAVKEGDAMRLYVNGKRVAAGSDASNFPGNCKLVVGQIDEVRNIRRFVGQLDELAVFPRALTEAEIARRYQLIRAQQPPRPIGSPEETI